MASDEITSAGHVASDTFPVNELRVSKSWQVTIETRDYPHDGPGTDNAHLQFASISAFDEDDLPWMTLAKWQKSLVLVGYVASLVTRLE